MKIAIYHQFLDNIGGAEKVVLTIAQNLQADIYTTNYNKKKLQQEFDGEIQSIGRVPQEPPFRQQVALILFHFFKSKKTYDLHLVAGEWAISIVKKNQPVLWYVHSPQRELWDLYKHTRKHLVSLWQRPLFDIWVLLNRQLMKIYAKKATTIICNSKTVQERIRKYLGRNANIIHPPINTKQFYYKRNGNFWLSVNRLLPHKRIGMQIEAFRKMPNKKLVIVGSYERAKHFLKFKKEILKNLPANVTLLHHIPDKELKELYATCKGVIATAKDEDFGLTVVEAMASGKPVIAGKEGGYEETIKHNKTGLLIKDINSEKIVVAVQTIEKNIQQYKKTCQTQAAKFDTTIFIKKIRNEIKKILAKDSVEKQVTSPYDKKAEKYTDIPRNRTNIGRKKEFY